MNIYFAIAGGTDYINEICSHGQENIYGLCAYPYRKSLGDFKPTGFKDFIADSGAFTAMTAGLKIDASYISSYVEWVLDNDIKHYVELDLDEVIGVDKTLEMTRKIENIVGYQSIPVWHCERGKRGWEEMCNQYPYVAISLSGYTKTSKWLRSHKYQPLVWFLEYARKTDTKVHALGCTNMELLKRYKFFSSDSSTYSVGGRYGTILEFRNGTIRTTRPNREYKKDKDLLNKHNIEQSFRMAQYAERYM